MIDNKNVTRLPTWYLGLSIWKNDQMDKIRIMKVVFVGVEKNKGSYTAEPRVMALSERHLIFRVSSNNLG